MIFLSLLTTAVLGALSAQAEVVTDFSNCSMFFYDGQEPSGMDQTNKKICQMYEDYSIESSFFATLYSTSNRIPVYSAYTFNKPKTISDEKLDSESVFDRNRYGARPPEWHIEPQLFGNQNPPIMSQEKDFVKNIDLIKKYQAVKEDYLKSGFDRGHLNPKAFQNGDGQTATCTLTNAVPMDPCFNRVTWRAWEDGLKKLLSNLTTQVIAKAYLVTGAVPSPNYRIPQVAQTDKDAKRVNVPTHVWTALCYNHTDKSESFSLGFIGENKPHGTVTLMAVENLNAILEVLYKRNSDISIHIFKDDCFSKDPKSEEMRKKLSAEVEVPQTQRLNLLLNSFEEAISTSSQSKGGTRKRKAPTRQYTDDASFFQQNKFMKILTGNVCMKTKDLQPNTGNRWAKKSELRKRDLEQVPKTIECELVPEKSNPSVKTAADGTHCTSGLNYCKMEDGFKLYCTTPCMYEESSKGYRCRSGQDSIECSPQYSRITAEGEKCKDDYPCATYGENYYWCWTGLMSWGFCSPPLTGTKTKKGQACRSNHACSKYGENDYWCYTDYDNNWDYCCKHNDPYSAVKGKTCKNPCGYYQESYLWCYTTDGSWNYCCVQG